ncbi:hypothetical protein HGRIS_011883 [Hohenbuehelia grisea]|uniref:Uncharacterized protein n=1 Tax=Hohenbuehelia grisea TaxID=104357 RepID=A0ABR3JYR1_9AGAR
MAKSQHPPSFSRLSSRFGLSKSHPHTPEPTSAPHSGSSSRSRKSAKNDDEWYIPYNGPYEPPPAEPRSAPPAGDRDSWGDIVQPLTTRFQLEDEPDSPHDPDFSHGRLRPRANTYTSSPPTPSSSSHGVLHKHEPNSMPHVRPVAGTSTSTTSGPSRRHSPPHAMDTAGGIGAAPVPALRASTSHSRFDHPTRRTHSHSHSRSHSGHNQRNNYNSVTQRHHPTVAERGAHTHSVFSSNSQFTGAPSTEFSSGSSPPAAMSLFSAAASGPGTRDSASVATTVLGSHRLSLASLFSTFGARQRYSQHEKERGKERQGHHEKEWEKERPRERTDSGVRRAGGRVVGGGEIGRDNQGEVERVSRGHPYNPTELPPPPDDAVIDITDLTRDLTGPDPFNTKKSLPQDSTYGERKSGWNVSKEDVEPISQATGPREAATPNTADAYYNSYYGTLVATPSSTRPSTFRDEPSSLIPPLPGRPDTRSTRNDPTRSPRLDMGSISRRRDANPSDTEDDEPPRGRSRYGVHPYANPRAFAFPTQEPSGQRDTDGVKPSSSPSVVNGSARGKDRSSRPPRLTFTAPSQHSSPAVGFQEGPHNHKLTEALASRSVDDSDPSHLRGHPSRSPPVTAPAATASHSGAHPHSHHQRRHGSPASPMRSLVPHPLQVLGARLKASMSTPNLRSTSSLSTYSNASSLGAGGGSAGATKTRFKDRDKDKDKEKHPTHTQRSEPVVVIADGAVPRTPPGLGHTGGSGSGSRTPVRAALVRGLDRWLSPETWCDALFLPKPRLRLHGDESNLAGFGFPAPAFAARGVSPPESPIAARDYALMVGGAGEGGGGGGASGAVGLLSAAGPPQMQSLESRVLAHARSVADFRPPAPEAEEGALDAERKHLGHSLGVSASNRGYSGSTSRARGATMPSQHSGSMPGMSSKRAPAVEQSVVATISAPTVSVTKPEGSQRPGKPPRPKSFALDDLALLSPVPSLTRVLAEGEILEHQRQKWQDQAQHSFQNKRSRSLSRARARSVTHKLKKERPKGHETDSSRPGTGVRTHNTDGDDDEWLWPRRPQGTLEFLVARSLLGNQDVVPTIRKRTLSASTHSHSNSQSHTQTDSLGRPSHSYSLAKTVSKSDRTHSRNDSWRSAMKIAKSTVGICGKGDDNVLLTPPDIAPSVAVAGLYAASNLDDKRKDGASDGTGQASSEKPLDKGLVLEGMLKGDSTQVIRLADPAAMFPDRNSSPSWGGSASDNHAGVGIAVTTSVDEHDRESIHIPSHPYAQTAVYPRRLQTLDAQRHDPVNGAHAPPVVAVPVIAGQQGSSRHPYAHRAVRDSYQSDRRIIGHARPDSDVPPHETMWAPMDNGVVQEVLPHDIQYSPFMTAGDHVIDSDTSTRAAAMRNSRMIYDTVGVGETLARAVQESGRDSGIGTSEEHGVPAAQQYHQWGTPGGGNVNAGAITNGARVSTAGTYSSRGTHREPVQYDATRPAYRTPTKASDLTSNHTLASSPPELLIPPEFNAGPTAEDDEDDDDSDPAHSPDETSSPALTSEGSSPRPSDLRIGQVDDYERFHDLFFKPPVARQQAPQALAETAQQAPPSSRSSVRWEPGPLRHRTASSGLTSLARQLSEELEEMQEMREAELREAGGSETASRFSDTRSRGTLHFMLSQSSPPASPTTLQTITELHSARSEHGGGLLPFRPSETIPEDVSRASSPTEEQPNLDEDLTERFRMGFVEAVSTPPSTMDDRRFSQQASYINHDVLPDTPFITSSPGASRIVSNASLLPPSASLTRSSYMTMSDASRMSGLSDFPVPPLQDQMTPGNMSIINSYFEGASQRRGASNPTSPGDRFNDDVDFAMALSSQQPQARR